MKIHNGWITKIQYIDELGEIISCSLDGFIHVYIYNIYIYIYK